MSKQPEALRIAEALKACYFGEAINQAAAELGRLHALNVELLEALRIIAKLYPSDFDITKVARAAIAKAEA